MRDHQLGWTLPAQPLGEAIKPEKPVKVCEFREFETKVYGAARLGEVAHQVRGIGSVVGDRPPHDAHGSVAAPPQSKWTPKVGDRFRFECELSHRHNKCGTFTEHYLHCDIPTFSCVWDDGDPDKCGWSTQFAKALES